LILYKYNGELLSVCPQSNQTYPFTFSRIVNINGMSGTAFLFDCDLLHAGQLNNCNERELAQYKLCHKQDLSKIKHLIGIRTEKTDVCWNTMYVRCLRKLSYYLEMPINYIFYPLMVKRESSDSWIGKIQDYIPITYYNQRTYDSPNLSLAG